MNALQVESHQERNIFLPTTFEQAERCAQMIANSSLCPPAFKGKAGDVFIAMQMGSEVGLSPMQAIQNIAVINGRPCLYGDAFLGVVRAHPHCESVSEWMEGSFREKNAIAFCEIKRKGQNPQVRSFSYEQAVKAGLVSKTGVWQQYPERMLQMRARGFAARDTFPDALRGIRMVEEVQDYEVIPDSNGAEIQRSQSRGVNLLKEKIGIQQINVIDQKPEEVVNIETGEIKESESKLFVEVKSKMEKAKSVDDLFEAMDLARSLDPDEKAKSKELYQQRYKELTS